MDVLRDGVQPKGFGRGVQRLGARRMKASQHRMQPDAVVAFFDLVIELVGIAQREQTQRKETIRTRAQRFARTRAEPRRQQRRRRRQRARHRPRRQLDDAARVGCGGDRAVPAPTHRDLEPLQQRARGQRLAAIVEAAQQADMRRSQQLRKRERLGSAALGDVGQPQLGGKRVAEQRVRRGRRTKALLVGSGQDDRSEGPQHRARERRDDHGGVGAVRRLGPKRPLFERRVQPVRELVEAHRVGVHDCGAVVQMRRCEDLATGFIVIEKHPCATALQRIAQRIEPAGQAERTRIAKPRDRCVRITPQRRGGIGQRRDVDRSHRRPPFAPQRELEHLQSR